MRKYLAFVILLTVVASLVGPMPPARAATPPGFATQLVIGAGLDGPSGFEIAPDGRIFILERTGKIKIFRDGHLLTQPFADLPSEASGDRGLIGIAFDPGFGVANHYVYFYYTGHDLLNHLVRFDASGDVGTDGPYTIFQTQSPSQLLHVGGSIRFGPDGKLYFAVGDNGYPPNAQDLSNPHGKILRINADGSIPADNPFAGQPGKLGAIWAYGFRNPWRFQFDSATGRLYAGDVGDYTWEELNLVVKGGNYGWPVHEGRCVTGCAGYRDPLTAYNHDGGSGAVTAGPVYRGSQFPPEYQGSLFFGDYSRGFIKQALLDDAGQITQVRDFDADAGSVVDLKVAPDGSLYYITYFPGQLYRVSYSLAGSSPVVKAGSDSTGGEAPLTVHFSSAGTSDPDGDDLQYHWDLGDGSTSTAANPVKTYTAVGVYPVTLTVSDGQNTVTSRPIVIQVGTPPTVTIAAPVDGARYDSGDTITYNVFGNDAAGFDVSDGDLRTEVFLHHNTHLHPFVGPLTGRVGTFTIPTTGEASADTWFELKVTATDRNGLSTSRSTFIYPNTSVMTFATDPPGLGLTLDGVPIPTPDAVQGVTGFKREIAAPPTAVDGNGTVYHFTGWSDGGAIRHFVTTPATDARWTANYAPSAPFIAEFFNNQNLQGPPVLVREDPKVDFIWSVDSPGPGVDPDHFSARWSKREFFAAGRYRFTVASDDGARLYLDDQLVIDQWHDQGPTAYDHVADLAAGEHAIRLEFYDNVVDASAKLTWETTPDQPRDVFLAEYWNTPGAGSAPTIPATRPQLSRDEAAVDHDWGLGSPAPAIDADHFVARYTRSVTLNAGSYDFTTTSDDGVRLWVDGQKVIDHWGDQGVTSYTASLVLGAGAHTIAMEYYENAAGALARLTWTRTADLPPPPQWTARYWNTPGAGSAPAIPDREPDLSRSESSIQLDGSPGGGIGDDHFVGVWTRTDVLPSGLYRFSGTADDGIRVFVDGQPVVDKWREQNEAFTGDKLLLGGAHEIRVEYYENAAGNQLHLTYQRVGDVTSPPGWDGAYYAGTALAGTAAIVRQEPAVDFDWGTGAPGPGLPDDGWSARWTRTDTLAAGVYTFRVVADDGVRLYVDGVLVLDEWRDQPPTTFVVQRNLAEGAHVIVAEYYERAGGAIARVSYDKTADPPPPTPWTASYYAGTSLAGEPLLTRDEADIDFDWGDGAPAAGVPADAFSARWTRTDHLAGGTYRITATSDDGIRVLLDGAVVIDGWSDHPPTTYTFETALTEGDHTITVEYFDSGGGALARCSVIRL
ncbi:PA14 domain-containing protein [Dactylosporangium sp. AC04546]|uniref:PA14 domain-containing protein n=1 Tax=Dactylosporangium sp. AC04546 TaxID=2862460 RepID=UPI002E7ACEED|nr:PA14 domain-containing protein [Dactylosporangium sp. AC04546]WVK79761.1 PA14 domain-containing protein [Dactylosporangium sp. AC04546]